MVAASRPTWWANRAGSMTAGTGGSSSGSMAHEPGRSVRTSSWNWRTHSDVAPSGSSSQSPVGGRSPPTVIVKPPSPSNVSPSLSSRAVARASVVPPLLYAVTDR